MHNRQLKPRIPALEHFHLTSTHCEMVVCYDWPQIAVPAHPCARGIAHYTKAPTAQSVEALH